MHGNFTLEGYGNVIESSLVSYDLETNEELEDPDAIRILELLLDKYHFADPNITSDNPLIANGVALLDTAIANDLSDVPTGEIVKVLGVIRFVARRRSKTKNRNYLRTIRKYVGQRLPDGSTIRIIE